MKKTLAVTLVCGTVLALSTGGVTAFASSNTQKAIDEKYVNADYMLGYSLNENQQKDVLEILNFNKDKEEFSLITAEGYKEVLGTTSTGDMQLYSSIKIEKLPSDKPLEVVIETGDPNVKKEERITRVTEDMYRNAALTSGIEHAKITVTTSRDLSVTGESALAGVYLSMKNKGIEVDEGKIELSNAEVGMLSQIKDENKDNKEYNDDKLNAALLDIKKGVADLSAKQLTEEQIQKIVEETLKTYKLDKVVSPTQVNMIINYSMDFGNLVQDMPKDEKKGLLTSIDDVRDDVFKNAKDTLDGLNVEGAINNVKEKTGSWWSSFTNWVSSTWDGWFGKDKTETVETEATN